MRGDDLISTVTFNPLCSTSLQTFVDNYYIQSSGCGFTTFATFKRGKFEVIKSPEHIQIFEETNWIFLCFSPDGTKTVWCVTCPSIHYTTVTLVVVLNVRYIFVYTAFLCNFLLIAPQLRRTWNRNCCHMWHVWLYCWHNLWRRIFTRSKTFINRQFCWGVGMLFSSIINDLID